VIFRSSRVSTWGWVDIKTLRNNVLVAVAVSALSLGAEAAAGRACACSKAAALHDGRYHPGSTGVERAWRFFSREVWEAGLSDLPSRQPLGYRAARIVYCTLRGLILEDSPV
jgi:hypothetical protein